MLDNIFDGFPNEASTSSDKHDSGHCSVANLGIRVVLVMDYEDAV